MNKKLIIFDCDGTLVDTEKMHAIGVAHVLEALGLKGLSVQHIHAHYAGLSNPDMFRDLEYHFNTKLPDNMIDLLFNARLAVAQNGIPAVEGAANILEYLQGRVKLAVASNGSTREVLNSLQSSGLLHFFGAQNVFTREMVTRPKPAPDLFLYACTMCHVLPENTVVIEDSVTGVRAAVAAGIDVLGFVGTADAPQSHAHNLKNAGADEIIYKLKDVKDLI